MNGNLLISTLVLISTVIIVNWYCGWLQDGCLLFQVYRINVTKKTYSWQDKMIKEKGDAGICSSFGSGSNVVE